MGKIQNTIYEWPVCSMYTPSTGMDVTRVIDLAYSEGKHSSIDKFFQKNSDLNKLLIDSNQVKNELKHLFETKQLKNASYQKLIKYIDNPLNISPVLANLIVLGHISSVESYFRELFRKIIIIDVIAQRSCREKMVSYGAALVHKRDALPDAILESVTFSGSYNISESLKEYLGIKGSLPSGLSSALQEYSKVCHLRHCIVHRFGKIGVNNAIKLDWDTHKLHVEKPIKIDFSGLQDVSQICSNIVKETNNFVWQMVMMRQISDYDGNTFKKKLNTEWHWKWGADRVKFKKYFDIFYSTFDPPSITDVRQAYNVYKLKYHSLL
jgi:hypothetical protein